MRVDGNYYECLCKRRNTMKGNMIKAAICALIAIFVFLALFVIPYFLIAALVLGYVFYSISGRFKVTYEYVFCDGQIDFDKILGGEARKHAHRCDLETVEVVAPENSHALDGYKHMKLTTIDYTSLEQGEGHKVYVIINKGAKGVERILFEPDETFVAMMKQKSPRKVNEY